MLLVVNQDEILLRYFEVLLKNGITTGITETMYFDLVKEVIEKINSSISTLTDTVGIEEFSFSNIVKKANQINSIESDGEKVGIKLQAINNEKILALPTYDLVKRKRQRNVINAFGRYDGDKVLDKILETKATQIKMSTYKLGESSLENLDIAKKVSAFYVNDLIKRYVDDRIKNGYWPSQCKDIDEFVFKRNIAKCINEKGTSLTFKKTYLQAMKVVCEILDLNQKRIEISNNPDNMLSYAHFLNFVLPSELQFLRYYSYNQYKIRNARMDITIENGNVNYKTCSCISSDPYGGWSDEYRREEGTLGNEEVLVMEKRIGKIN